jgi:low affinity Fe/Cu permease
MQVKLDEIIRAIGNAKNELLDLEELEEGDLIRIRKSYEDLAREARAKQRQGGQGQEGRRGRS